MGEPVADYSTSDRIDLLDVIEKLTAERDLLRRELFNRAGHSLACRHLQLVCAPSGGVRSAGPCDCGLNELLERLERGDE